MNVRTLYRFTLAAVLLICSAYPLYSQDSNKDGAGEETKWITDSVQAIIGDTGNTETTDDEEEEEEDLYPIDTTIASNLRTLNPDSLRKLKNDKAFYYQYTLDSLLRNYRSPEPKELPNLGWIGILFDVLTFLLWAGVVVLLVFIVMKIFGVNGKGFYLMGRNRKNKSLDAAITEEEHTIDPDRYDELIRAAASAGDFRLATRYLFLQTLNELSKKQYVEIGTDKTNYQYITETRRRSAALAQELGNLVLKYEYIWYGEYEIVNTTYASLEQAFKTFNRNL